MSIISQYMYNRSPTYFHFDDVLEEYPLILDDLFLLIVIPGNIHGSLAEEQNYVHIQAILISRPTQGSTSME